MLNFPPTSCYEKIFLFIYVHSVLFAQNDCELRSDENNIKVFACFTDASKYKAIRAEFTLNASYEKLEAFLRDVNNYPTWQYEMEEALILKNINDDEFVYYAKIKMPWPADDRDVVLNFKFSDEENQHIVKSFAIMGLTPLKENTVRITYFKGQWTITEIEENKLFIKYELEVDPAGMVPAWLVNMVCTNAPAKTFKKLKEQLEK